MKRFLSTTAVLAALLGPAAYAQTSESNFGTITAQEGDFHASDLIGMRIYNSETELEDGAMIENDARNSWEDVGEINDLIVSADGEVTAVILGVGGFLGMGERHVSVSMDELRTVTGDGDERFLVVTTTREELETAPAYEREDEAGMAQTEQSDAAATTQPAATGTATGDAATEETGEVAEEAEANTEEMATETDAATGNMAADSGTERTLLTAPTVEREGYQPAEAADIEQLTAEVMLGSTVYGPDDETVGDVDDLVMAEDGSVEQIVINVGGFLGLGERSVAVIFDELQILRNVEGGDYRFYIDSSEEALEAQPEYEE